MNLGIPLIVNDRIEFGTMVLYSPATTSGRWTLGPPERPQVWISSETYGYLIAIHLADAFRPEGLP